VASWEQIKGILHEAIAVEPRARARYLDDVCGADANLRAELDSLLAAEAQLSESFMGSPLSTTLDRGLDRGDFGATGLESGQLFAERFLLIRKLGEGGMGQVWLAEQAYPVRRTVALKLIGAGMYDETTVQRFQSERQSIAIMDHPCIAKVFDAGTSPQGQPYFVMEFVPGLPITEYCDQKKLGIAARLEIFIRACEGVQHAHQKAVIHRDLKPANILVVEVDAVAVPRIIDFGLAKATTRQRPEDNLVTEFGLFMGTPGYMSPEQVDQNTRDVDTRTDVYTLGVILYVLLTGVMPFAAKRGHRPALDVWLRQLREQEPPPMISKLASDPQQATITAAARSTDRKQLVKMLRGDLQWIVSKALERERERRYGSPAELAADLRRYLNDESVQARPQSAGYQLRKFIRRNRLATAVAGMLVVLAVAAAAAGLVAIRKQHEAEFQAARVRQAQSRLLTQAAAQRLKDSNVAGAQGIILEVLRNPEFAQRPTPAAIHVFQDVRARDAQLAVLAGHGAYVNAGVFSPDGTRVVTASDDKTARVWDARTGVEILAIVGHQGYVNTATFSPDGTRVVTASDDRTAAIWDARTGQRIASLLGHGDVVESAIYSPDGTRILTASDDQTAHIWDARTGATLTVLSGHTGYVYGAAYSPDGNRIVTASSDKTARIWDAHTGAQLLVLAGHGGYVNAAAFSPDNARVVSVSEDNIARIWNARTGAPLLSLTGHTGAIYCAAFSPDGKRIVTTSRDRTVRLWDALTGVQLAVFAGHRDRVSSGAFSPDGTRIITTSFDETARIWDASLGHELLVFGHDSYLYSGSYSPDGARIVTGAGDATSRIWDARTGAQSAVLTGHGDRVTSAVYAPDGTRVVTGSIDKSARIWDLGTGAQPRVLAASGNGYVMSGGYVYGVAYSPDGTRIATASTDQTARIWDASTGAPVLVLSGHRGYVYGVAFSPDGTRLATASADKSARVWDARTGVQLAILSGHDDRVNSISFSPDGTRLVTGSDDRTARVWDARTGLGTLVLTGHEERVNSARFSPDGRQIVTASADKSARIWDAQTGEQLAVLTGHTDSVTSGMYSPDGSRIVTVSGDKSARVWDARVQGTLTAQILWYAAAETDPLPQLDRTELGLPADAVARSWPAVASGCDRAAASVFDPDRLAPGNLREGIAVDIALAECAPELAAPGHAARADYQMGRVLFAKGDAPGAQHELEIAAAHSYRTAAVELADLLVTASTNGRDSDRAASLYEQAWRQGVPIAGFKLGQYYEHRSHPDMARAWQWYQRAAEGGQANALARFAEREERDSLDEKDAHRRKSDLLAAFALYAQAAELARRDDWPDDAWKTWRYRRATLARLLAREGMMQQVAEAYAAVGSRSASPSPNFWERVRRAFH